MKICPQCTSDSHERTSSTGLRVVGCIVLLFIPYGFFICWVPFVLPHKFLCNVCGYHGKEEELLNLDWRESEELKGQHRELHEKLQPVKDMWVQDTKQNSYKVIHGKGQYLLLKVLENNIVPYRIVGYDKDTDPKRIMIKDNLVENFNVTSSISKIIDKSNVQVNDFGKTILLDEEVTKFFSCNVEEFSQWLNEQAKVALLIDIEVLPNTERTIIEGKNGYSNKSTLFTNENEEEASDSKKYNDFHV
ncbi:MAG: hypothetical protein APF76_06905 [Desulfitibacter sp. BRH_c19]|nr:MAG: hypothetical protein APF76_06905 [Desulfitibacter sp. BRH_c19]